MSSNQTRKQGKNRALRGRIDLLPDGAAMLRLTDGGKHHRIPKSQLPKFVAHGDVVEAHIKGRDVVVDRILRREPFDFEGRLQLRGKKAFVVPDNPLASRRIFVQNKGKADQIGDERRVAARLKGLDQNDPRPAAEVLHEIDETSVLESVLKKVCDDYEVRQQMPDAVEAEAAKLTERQYEPGPFVSDLRSLPMVTIDGYHAKDFDDAVWARKTDSGFEAIIAIADVSSYVKDGSIIDSEAARRGTSVYFPQTVFPMLPERLSNDLCSLVPGQDRPVVAVKLEFDHEGTRTGADLMQGWMHSQARLTYAQVNDYLQHDDVSGLKQTTPVIRQMLGELHELTSLRWQQRRERGALEFDLPEPEYVIGMNGEVTDILFRERGPAQQLIEELMISANEAVAEILDEAGLPVVYRVHPEPTVEKYAFFRRFTHNLGFQAPPQPNAEVFKRVVSGAAGTPLERSVNVLVLRTMSVAQYSYENVGHFGLSLDHYCHFTSPIRRYPDLLNHRLAVRYLKRGGVASSEADEIRKANEKLIQELSDRERQAEQAERTYARSLKARFLESRVGERFSGVVSGCTKFGLFIELEDYLIDGLLSVRELGNDYFVYQEERMEMVGKNSGVRFRLGDLVEVELISVDVRKGFVDFRLIEHNPISYGRLSA